MQIINPTNNPKMKAIVVICILLAFLLFSSPSIIVARELADPREGNTGRTDKPAITSCGKPGNPAYSKCIGKQKPIKCEPKNIFRRCKPPQGP